MNSAQNRFTSARRIYAKQQTNSRYARAIRNAIEACRKLAEFDFDEDIKACAGDTAADLKYFANIYATRSRDAAEEARR